MDNITLEQPKRPVVVTIIAILIGIQAVVGIFVGLFSMLAGMLTILSFLGILITLIALAELGFAWGLWNMKRWAYWAIVIIEIVQLVSSLLLLTQPGGNVGRSIANIIFPAAILIYFLASTKVRAAFRT